MLTGQDGEPRFVAKDVAEVLGYKNTRKAMQDHCKGLKILKGNESLPLTDSPRGITIIQESDVYRLIMRSKLPQAENFQDWVTTDILPTIRRHGMYATDDVIEKTFTDPDSIIQIMERLKKERAENLNTARHPIPAGEPSTLTHCHELPRSAGWVVRDPAAPAYCKP